MPKPVMICLVNCILCLSLQGMQFQDGPARYITSFSFRQFSGGVILLKGCVNNISDSLNFILDTGSGGISLDSSTCVRLGLSSNPSKTTIRGIGGARNVKFSYNNSLRLPGLQVDSLNFHINDYELLTNVYGEHIDGIIGHSFLSRYIVKVNYDSNRIYVYTPGYIRYPRGGYILRPAIRSIPVQRAVINEYRDIHSSFYFDIGAGMCLLLSEEFARDSIRFDLDKNMFDVQVEGIGGKAQMKLTTIRQFQLGPYRLKKVPAYIFEDTYNITDYPQLGGLIGNDLLRRFNIIMNYRENEIHLLPNRHYREPFDYSYTGLGFYYLDGQVRITEIMIGSPAEKAGLKPGDIIAGIDNMIGKDIQEYKTLLMEAGRTVKMLIIRDGQPLQIPLKIKNILKP